MAVKVAKNRELKGIGYELFIGALSILLDRNHILLLVVRNDPNLDTVLQTMNAIMFPHLSGGFFLSLLHLGTSLRLLLPRLRLGRSALQPPLSASEIFRVFRIWRVVRLFMEFGARNLVKEFVTHRAENALLSVGFLVLCVLEFGSLAVLSAERTSPDANITNASDAIWWAYVTITTVGYGDQFPVTNWGRIVGVLVMTAGVGLFGTLSGFLANMFLSPAKPEAEERPATDADTPKAKLAQLKQLIAAQEQATAELKVQLEEMDKLL